MTEIHSPVYCGHGLESEQKLFKHVYCRFYRLKGVNYVNIKQDSHCVCIEEQTLNEIIALLKIMK